jgi:hypothetical protein
MRTIDSTENVEKSFVAPLEGRKLKGEGAGGRGKLETRRQKLEWGGRGKSAARAKQGEERFLSAQADRFPTGSESSIAGAKREEQVGLRRSE